MKQQPFVLLVEDDEKLREIETRYLRAAGYMVLEAASFREALTRMAIKPAVMILDINLPDASGWQVAQWLDEQVKNVPVIVTSGLYPDEQQMEHFKPVAFLAKPFAAGKLLDLVRQYAPVA